MKYFKFQWIVFVCIYLIQTPGIARPKQPVAMLITGNGIVSFSRDGNQWEPVNRNKFVFEGDQIRTGQNTSCKLIFEHSDYTKYIKKNSQVILTDDDLKLVSGQASDLKIKTFNLMDNLRRKFARIQRFTVVLRSKSSDEKLRLPKTLFLSDSYPELAWENKNSAYSYRLECAGQTFDIPKSDQPIIRKSLINIKPGKYTYSVQVLENDTVHYTKKATCEYLSETRDVEIQKQKDQIKKISNQGFLLGNYMDEVGLKVAALDYYRQYFDNVDYDKELIPFLIKVYSELGMTGIVEKEIKRLNQQR